MFSNDPADPNLSAYRNPRNKQDFNQRNFDLNSNNKKNAEIDQS